MKNSKLHSRTRSVFGGFALCLLANGQPSGAQSVLAPPPIMPVTPPAVLAAQTNRPGETLIAPAPTSAGPESPFRWGPVTLHPHAMYRFTYGNGLDYTPGHSENTIIQEVLPGVLFNIGSHVTLDYTPTLRFYSSDRFRDTVDHTVRFTAGGVYEDWTWGVFQGYSSSSQPLVETATQTDQESFLTALTARYQLNTRMSLDLGLNQDFTSTEAFSSYRQWSTMDWLNFNLYERITVSVGAGFGFLDYDTGSDTTFEQLQGRVIWHASDKIGLQVHGGAEDRQFLDSSAPDLINPVFGASLEYRPIEVTTLSIAADRAVNPSYFTHQVTEATTVTAAVSQRIFEKVYLSLTGGYSTQKYVATTDAESGRTDDYYFFGARATVHVIRRGSVSIFYQHNENSSNEATLYSFSSDQVGFELGYSY